MDLETLLGLGQPPLWLTVGLLAFILCHPQLRRIFLANLRKPFEPGQAPPRQPSPPGQGGPAWLYDTGLALTILAGVIVAIVSLIGIGVVVTNM